MDRRYEPLSARLSANHTALSEAFEGCYDIQFREVRLPGETGALLVYLEGIVDTRELNQHAMEPLLLHLRQMPEHIGQQLSGAVPIATVSTTDTIGRVITAILEGKAALLADGHPRALLLHVKGGNRRSVEEPPTETVIRGPREGFTEELTTNTALLRFKLKSPDLKLTRYTIGEQTQTRVVLAYLQGVADPKVVAEVERRLQRIKIDGVLESGYIEELIEDDPLSPFPQLHYTERPDTVAAHLLEGRFAIFVDGTPFVMMGPVTFWELLQASEDYYERYLISTLIRWLRYLFVGVALFLPALYVAITTFHQDMLPTTLLLSIAAAREPIPFPALVEAFMMEISFEALREASIRLPTTVGQAVSILGALVIGQAAVQAGIVSAPMVIIVSLTGIASFTIPRFNAAIAIRILRFPLMLLGGAFGLFGVIVGTCWLAVHVVGLRSFGVPYMSGTAPVMAGDLKDVLIRAPWWMMGLRPSTYLDRNRRRVGKDVKPAPPGSAR